MSSLVRTFVGTFIFCLTISCVRTIHHQPQIAAEIAQNFAVIAFVSRDFDHASAFVDINSVGRPEAIEKLRKTVEQMHPSGEYPEKISVTNWAPVPGSDKVKIYLAGVGAGGQDFHYLFVMKQNHSGSYGVSEIYRNFKDTPHSGHGVQ